VELTLLLKFLRRWWLIILIPSILAFLWSLPAIPSAINPPETYGATIRFTAATPPETVGNTYEDSAYVPWLASEYVVVNLPTWVTSQSFADEVSGILASKGIDISGEEVRRGLAADSARSILTVYFGWDDKAELEAIANATIEVLQTRNQQYFPQFALQPAQITPLDKVEVVQTFPPITSRFAPFIRIALGVGVGLGLAMLAAYLDDRVYDGSDIPSGLEALAIIPRE
jgi:capsular polysaccharide biosynthesis protein